MKLAVWCPMPPSPSGIADYAAEQLEVLGERFDLTVVSQGTLPRPPADLDLYQLGNSPAHGFVYDAALGTRLLRRCAMVRAIGSVRGVMRCSTATGARARGALAGGLLGALLAWRLGWRATGWRTAFRPPISTIAHASAL